MQEANYNCYICDNPIDDTNESSEHIILNGIGGKLPDVNVTYCYDVINNAEVNRTFSLPVNRKWIADYSEYFKKSKTLLFSAAEKSMEKILRIWQEREREN